MTDALVRHADHPITLERDGVLTEITLADGVTLSATGCVIDHELTIEEFCSALQNVQTMANASLWGLGDLLLYGEARGDYGEMYSQALDATKKSYATLTQSVRVAKAYPPPERVAAVSWSHHREAAGIKDPAVRSELLYQAAREGWSRETLRERVQELKGDLPAPALTTCPQCGHAW